MFVLFGTKENKPSSKEKHRRLLSGQVFGAVNKIQQRLASGLQRQSERLSKKVKVVLFISFCFMAGICCIYRIANSFSKSSPISLVKSFIQKPKYALLPINDYVPLRRSTKPEYLRIQAFKGYMDSLARSPGGRHIHDSIKAARPYLMDSIALIEKW